MIIVHYQRVMNIYMYTITYASCVCYICHTCKFENHLTTILLLGTYLTLCKYNGFNEPIHFGLLI